ncbi:hypothetical protein EXIGLDRAFT_763391 [Exidia glandulosa HHB12029]|uniref:Uncharacterized protein n=1 Tax=Exidia glandulosa HHB12029 TaxID=1314781 RepID=A0A165LZ90_EXIGL|nr:hypothetical protein EXIGLDRAFT_763391 [Exidia glandulosa HHB12029]
MDEHPSSPTSPTNELLRQHLVADEAILVTINDQVAAAHAAVRQAEQDLVLARALLRDALSKRDTFTQSMQRKRAALAVFPSLPVELLCVIFEHRVRADRAELLEPLLNRNRTSTSTSDSSSRPPKRGVPSSVVAASVCQSWRNAAVAHPPLWTDVTLQCSWSKPRTDHLQLCMLRAGDLGMDIVHLDHCGSSCSTCTLPCFTNLYSRCTSLVLALRHGHAWSPRPKQLQSPTPLLRTVILLGGPKTRRRRSSSRSTYPSASDMLTPLLGGAPLLTSVTLLDVSIPFDSCIVPSETPRLTTIRIETEVVRTSDVSWFGTRWPYLRHLALGTCEYDFQSTAPSILPCLESLHIGPAALPFLNFVRREHVPALTYVAIPVTVPSLSSFAVFLAGQDYPSLHELHFFTSKTLDAQSSVVAKIEISTISSILAKLPNLRVIRFSEQWLDAELLDAWMMGLLSPENPNLSTLIFRACTLKGTTGAGVGRAIHELDNLRRSSDYAWSEAAWTDYEVTVRRSPNALSFTDLYPARWRLTSQPPENPQPGSTPYAKHVPGMDGGQPLDGSCVWDYSPLTSTGASAHFAPPIDPELYWLVQKREPPGV